VQPSRGSFIPAGWSDYNFGSENLWFLPESDTEGPPEERSLNGITDAVGKDSINVHFTSLKEPLPVTCTCEASVTDVNYKNWSDKVTLLIHPAAVYVGVKASHYFYKKGEPIEFHYVVTDLDGKPVAGKKVNLQLCFIDGEQSQAAVQTRDITSGDQPTQISFDSPKGGSYQIIAIVTDDRGRKNKTRVQTWVANDKQAIVKTVDQQKLLLIPDRKTYKPGDTAQISINAPFPNSHGLLTVRKHGIALSKPLASNTSSFTFELPITSDFYPAVSLQADLVGDNCAYATGEVALDVPPADRKLDLTVTPKLGQLSPGGDTTLALSLKDADGKPISGGQVALAVVDEALLAIADYSWPNPIDLFYPQQTVEVGDSHNRAFLILPTVNEVEKSEGSPKAPPAEMAALPPPGAMPPPLPGAPDTAVTRMGGGSGSGSSAAPIALRTNFAELALFAPAIQTDANGQAEIKLHLPDSVTRYRIMAAAVAGDNCFGSSESNITARLPLMVKPSLPRFLNLGDQCELPVVLQNQTDDKLKVSVVVRAENAKLKNSTPSSGADGKAENCDGTTIEVPAHDRVEVQFPARTDTIGNARFQFGAASNDLADAAEISLPVYKPATFEAFAAYGQIDNGAELQKIQPPANALPNIGGLSVTTSSTAVQSLTDAYFYLKDYQYECSEQLSSRMLSMLSLRDVLSAFGSLKKSHEDPAAYDDKIKRDMAVLLRRQRRDGAFALWSLYETSNWPYVSIQVTRALLLARAKGFDVPAQQMDNAMDYIGHIQNHLDKGLDAKTKRSLRAYALYVQSLSMKTDTQAASQLLQETLKGHARTKSADYSVSADMPNLMSVETAAWLLPVLAKDKQSSDGAKLLKDYIASQIEETASTAQVSSKGYAGWDYLLFYSPRRETAAVLDCLIRTQPDSDLIAKLAKGLMAQRVNGMWQGTQENAYILIALSNYFATYEKKTPEFVVQLWLGNKFVGSDKFVGRSTESQNVTIPIEFLQKAGTQDLLINKDGAGRLYYRVGMDYVPDNFNLPPADYGFSVQRTFEPVDKTSDVRKDADGVWHFKAGATVRTKVTFSCLGMRYHVALADPLAAGTEPVNPELSGNRTLVPAVAGNDDATPDSTAVPPPLKDNPSSPLASLPPSSLPPPPMPASLDDSSSDDRPNWSPWWTWSWIEHQDLRDHEAEAFASLLNAGTYSYSYMVKATTPGAYIVPPCKAEEMYMPETFGRTGTERVIVE